MMRYKPSYIKCPTGVYKLVGTLPTDVANTLYHTETQAREAFAAVVASEKHRCGYCGCSVDPEDQCCRCKGYFCPDCNALSYGKFPRCEDCTAEAVDREARWAKAGAA